jgi:K+/H+ antiporter YhaU regulatory subunit KhtT
MTVLKTELRKARQWKSAFDEVSQSEDQMQNKTQEINELITESKTLCVDVTEFIDSVLQATRMYCLCRQVYFGHMIGCDTCDEWYHFQCVGLTQAQAEKADKYVCIRCMLKSSIQSTAAYCAKITNKWMDCTEHFRAAEMNIQKVNRESSLPS